ncbi:Chaperone protein DnaJ [Halorhabdus tiamatea SARL4B]|uniref:Chaperone protein DnaJ n=1 Tax=Halorhabdus tiamatea SARL4B TaxID=1033806 RepID=F7PPE3_9EURY|nr:DnaJ domain-containing protein [Halorhabdus tiamatea]ERJ04572.1 Chaperone protein DnaJ [Halorhabdus tiamatea SARL4B]CCQ32832.1 chaperone protein DnaJ [Halorhabdus tiamatea SARL4B]
MVRTYYDVLGVEESASTAEIETAYRDRLKETHPDVTDDPDATDAVQVVIDARDVLTDEAERARYDRLGHEAYVSGDPTRSVSKSSDSTGPTASRTRSDDTDFGQSERTSTSGGESGRRRQTAHTGRERTPGSPPSERPRDADRRQSAGGADAGHAWANGAGGTVAQPSDPNAVRWSRLFPTGQSVVLLLAAFVCYPPFVLFSVYPPFPTVFNLIVAACTLVLAGYLVSLPEVGVVVFGFWGLVTAGAMVSGSLGVLTLPGVLAMTATWIPFGLSVVVFRLVRY